MTSRTDRFLALSGVAFAVCAFGAFASSSGGLSDSSPGPTVSAFYVAHRGGQRISDILWTLAFAMFLVFAGVLRAHLRSHAELLAGIVLASASVVTAGAVAFFGYDFVLAADPKALDPGAAQALNMLAFQGFLPALAGTFVFGTTCGLAIITTRALPTWLGVAAVVIGVGAVTPAAFVALLLLAPWSLVAGVVLYRRGRVAVAQPQPTSSTATV